MPEISYSDLQSTFKSYLKSHDESSQFDGTTEKFLTVKFCGIPVSSSGHSKQREVICLHKYKLFEVVRFLHPDPQSWPIGLGTLRLFLIFSFKQFENRPQHKPSKSILCLSPATPKQCWSTETVQDIRNFPVIKSCCKWQPNVNHLINCLISSVSLCSNTQLIPCWL